VFGVYEWCVCVCVCVRCVRFVCNLFMNVCIGMCVCVLIISYYCNVLLL